MSGGRWDYTQSSIKEHLKDIARDEEVKKRFPRLANSLKNLAGCLGDILHDLDWDLSGDHSIEDDYLFEERSLEILLTAIDASQSSQVRCDE